MADDLGVVYTDRKLSQLEKKIHQVYSEAQKDIEKKLNTFLEKSAAREKLYLQRVAEGKMTQEAFDKWKAGQVFVGQNWKSQQENIAHVLSNANQVATQMINGEKADVFCFNGNYTAYDMEHGFGVNLGFDLYDEKSVERLIKDNPQMLPKPRIDIPKDERWNMKNIRNQITQGIIQGESIPKIAKRLYDTVPGMNERQSYLHARTAMTGAQNGGRQARYEEAEKMGIKFKKEWLATLDGRTRDTHRDLDGQTVKPDESFEVEGMEIRFPGDPTAHPSLVYNCRCTMVTKLDDYPHTYDRRGKNMIGDYEIEPEMTYREWEKAKWSVKDAEKTTDAVTLLGKAADGFSDADKQNMMGMIQNADPVARDVWLKNVGSLEPSEPPDPKYKSKAYYAPFEGKVHFNINEVVSGDTIHTPYENFFHEFAHNIDHLNGVNGLYFSEYFTGKDGKTLAQMLEIENKKILTDAFEAWRVKNGYNTNMTFSFAMKNKYYRQDVFWELNTQVRGQYGAKGRANISDMFEPYSVKKGGGTYPWGAGHGSSYAKSGQGAKETFAEMTDATFANPESLQAIKQYYPRSYALWKEMMSALLK